MQNPIIIHLNYPQLIHGKSWRIAFIFLSWWKHKYKALLVHGSRQTYHLITCAHQVTCIFLRADSCAIECIRRLLAETVQMSRRATAAFYCLAYIVFHNWYFCPCPCRISHLRDRTIVGHILNTWHTHDTPTRFVPKVLNKCATTRQPYNFHFCHVPPVWVWLDQFAELHVKFRFCLSYLLLQCRHVILPLALQLCIYLWW